MEKAVKARILAKTRGVCATCGKGISKDTMTVDHYIPKSLGGHTRESNLFPMCKACNIAKADTIYEPDSKVYPYVLRRYIDNMCMEYEEYIKQSQINNKAESKNNDALEKELVQLRKEIAKINMGITKLNKYKGVEIEFNGTGKIHI